MTRPRSAPGVGAEEETAAFLRDLRALRDQAGLRPTELAARAHFPEETLAEAESGPALPSLPVLEAYVRACGATPAKWEDRWRRLTQGAVTAIGLPTRQPSMAKAPARIVPFPGTDERDMAGIPAVSAEAMLAAAAEPSVPPVAAPPPGAAPAGMPPPGAAPAGMPPPGAAPAGMPPPSLPRPAAPAEPSPAEPAVTVPAPAASSSWFEPTSRTSNFQAAPTRMPPTTAPPPLTVPPATAPPATAPPATVSGAAATGHRAEPEHRGPDRTLTAVAIILMVLAAAVAAWLALHG